MLFFTVIPISKFQHFQKWGQWGGTIMVEEDGDEANTTAGGGGGGSG